MNQGKKILFFIHTADYVFYYRDVYGEIQPTKKPTPITISPIGWDKIAIKWRRSTTFWGMDRISTVPLDFVSDGADVLKEIAYSFGLEKKIFITVVKEVLETDGSTYYGFVYDTLFKGEPDWTTFVHDGPKVTVSLVEGGLAKLIKANKGFNYELDMDVPEAQLVQHTGINIKEKKTFVVYDIGRKIFPSFNEFIVTMPVQDVATEGTSSGMLSNASEPIDLVDFDLATDDTRWILKSIDQLTNVIIKGDFKFHFNYQTAADQRTRMYFSKQDGTTYDIFPDAIRPPGDYTASFNGTIPLLPGEKLFIFFKADGQSDHNYFDSEFTAEYFTRYKTTLVKYLKPFYVFQQLIKRITGGLYDCDSFLLKFNEGYALTCGDALRGLPGSKMKISLDTFEKWADAMFCVGMGIVSGKIIIEDRATWYTGNNAYLDATSRPKFYPATELLFNSIKAGYEKQTYDSVNGRDEFNTETVYSVPRTSVTAEYNIVSPVRGDCFGIELTRRNLDNKQTTDGNSDNDVFVTKCITVSGGTWIIDRNLNATTTGVIDPTTVFNLPIRPSELIKRHGWWIRSCCDKLDNESLVYITNEKNSNVVVGGVPEKSNIPILTLAAAKFKPWFTEFETKVLPNYETLMTGTGVMTFNFFYNGVRGVGIAMETGCEPVPNGTQVYKLLLDSTTDIAKFKNIYG